MTDPDGYLDRVRKLLAKAEDPGCTPAEAEALNLKAAELVAKYGIDAAMLAASGQVKDTVGQRIIEIRAPYARSKVTLLANIVVMLRGRIITTQTSNVTMAHIFGFTADLDRIELLYTSLLVQAQYGLIKQRPPHAWESIGAYRRSWFHGFSIAVGTRLEATERSAQTEHEASTGTSTALVLADRSALVNAAVSETFPSVRDGRPRKLQGSGRQAGYQAGMQADLGGQRVAGQGRREIGR